MQIILSETLPEDTRRCVGWSSRGNVTTWVAYWPINDGLACGLNSQLHVHILI